MGDGPYKEGSGGSILHAPSGGWPSVLMTETVVARLNSLSAENERLKGERDEAVSKRPLPVVCICGSTRFADEHAIARWELEKDGLMVCVMINYLPAWWAESQGWNGNDHFGEITGRKQVLDGLHMRKIDMANAVLVVAVDGYVGESTKAEIAYAESKDLPVFYATSGDMAVNATSAWLDTFLARLDGEEPTHAE